MGAYDEASVRIDPAARAVSLPAVGGRPAAKLPFFGEHDLKTISPALQAHLAGVPVTLSDCIKVTRRDGAVYGFTSHTRNLTIGGVVYKAATGFFSSAIRTSSALNVDNAEMTGVIDSVDVVDADILAGKWGRGRHRALSGEL
jgi:hypothetical protein